MKKKKEFSNKTGKTYQILSFAFLSTWEKRTKISIKKKTTDKAKSEYSSTFVCGIAMGRAKASKILHLRWALMEDAHGSAELSLAACQARDVNKSNPKLSFNAFKFRFRAMATRRGTSTQFLKCSYEISFHSDLPHLWFHKDTPTPMDAAVVITAFMEAESTW